jgi:hypothetical protein
MIIDQKAKGSEDFFAGKKDLPLFHATDNGARLYREGWHAARRWAEDNPTGTMITFLNVPPTCGKTPHPGEPVRAIGGSFTITTLSGATTEPIPHDATEQDVRKAMITAEQVKLATGETKKRRVKEDAAGQGSLF